MADKFQLKAVITAVDKLSPTLKGIALQAKIVKKSLGDVGNISARLGKQVAIGGAVVGAGLFAAAKKIVSVSAEFERFETILTTVEGSSEKAKASMKWVEDFARKTPYELTEVMDSFVKLKAYGIDPTNGTLATLGDTAAAMGKPVIQAVEAMADAMTGENERLKEFGIRASKTGNTIAYEFTNSLGEQVTKKVKANNRAMIQSTLNAIWNEKYGGAMDKLSQTWDGMWSNLQDTFTGFIRKIGGAGFFDAVKKHLGSLMGAFESIQKSGELDRLTKLISDDLTAAVNDLADFLKKVKWEDFYNRLKEAVKWIKQAVEDAGGLKNILFALGALSLAGPVASILDLAQTLGRLGYILAATPLGALLAAIGVAGYLIYTNWDKISPMLSGVMESFSGLGESLMKLWELVGPMLLPVLEYMGEALGNRLVMAVDILTTSIKGMVDILTFGVDLLEKVGSFVMPDWLKNKLGIGDIGAAPGGASSHGASGTFGNLNPRTQLNGEMTVRFENAPPQMRVSPGKTNQSGFELNPDVGYNPLRVFGM